MGFGDDTPPAVRADPYPATLQAPGGFRLLFLTFTSWDVIKYAVRHGSAVDHEEIKAIHNSTDALYPTSQPGVPHAFTARGCAKAADGSTGYCSPVSDPLWVTAASNTRSLRTFLRRSGVDTRTTLSVRQLLARANRPGSLHTVMNPGG